MDALDAFNPLDVLAAAAAWQSANQVTSHVDAETSSQHSDNKVINKLRNQPLVRWRKTHFLDHSYAYVPRDVDHDNDVDDVILVNGHDVGDYDDVDSAVQNGHVTESEPEPEAELSDQQINGEDVNSDRGQLFVILNEDSSQNSSLIEHEGDTAETVGVVCTEGRDNCADVTQDGDSVDGVETNSTRKLSTADNSSQLETNNNTKITTETVRDDSSTPLDGDVKLPLQIVTSNNNHISHTESSIPDQNIPNSNLVITSLEADAMSPKNDETPRIELALPKNDVRMTTLDTMTSLESSIMTSPKAADSVERMMSKLGKPHELMVRREGLLSDKLVSPPAHVPRHTCVSIDCCSPSDISAVARDLCVDRMSSASSQDLYMDDGQESPRSMKMALSPPGKPKRQQRGVYNIPLGPLLSDAHDRPEHPLKDHDYCLHSFYLAMTHNRIDEPVRRPGPQPKCKDQKAKRGTEKSKNKRKRRSKDDFDSDLSPFKEDVFSDTDSFSLDSPSKSRMSSPTNSVASSLDLCRERSRMRDKRMNSLPCFGDKPKESTAMSNFNDNYVFFGKKPKRRNRTLVETNHDKLKKFNHSEFLPGLDISYLEARAKFHKKVEPETKIEISEVDVTSGQEVTLHGEVTTHVDVSLPKGGLAFGISEEESQFIDSLHCDPHMEAGAFHPHEEITQEQVKELLTVVGVDNAMKLIESSDLHHDHNLHDQVNSLNVTVSSVEQSGLSIGHDYNGSDSSVVDDGMKDETSNIATSLELSTSTVAVSMDSKTEPVHSMSGSTSKSPVRPRDLPFSPLKAPSAVDLPLGDHGIPDLGEDLATPEMHDAALLGGTTPDLNIATDLGATSTDLPYGGTTPHDLLDLDDNDLLNANLNLNMNMVLNFQSPEKVYHPNAGTAAPTRQQPILAAQRKLDLELSESFTGIDKDRNRGYVRNNPQTMGKPDQVLKSQMFKSLSELRAEETQDHGVPELITVNMYWNDLPGLLINGKQYVRLVDIHKQVLPAKPTGLLKNRCRALNMEIGECTELQRDFLIRYAHAAASRSQIIVTKEVAETLIGYYVDKPPARRADDSASLADGSTYSYNADDIARLEDVMKPKKKRERKTVDSKPRGRPKGTSLGSSCVNITFRLAGEVFQKRVQTSGFSLLCGDSDSDDSDSDIDHRISSAAARFQKILNLRAQIKSIRAEIYAIQKRQQRADIRKSKGLAKRQRSKPSKRMIFNYEPKRLVKAMPVARNTVLQPNVEKLLPTVRVAPNMDYGVRTSTPACVSPAHRSTTPNVIVESCQPFSAVPSAIVTPLNPRTDEEPIPLDTSLESSFFDSDLSKNGPDLDKSHDRIESESSFDRGNVVLVKHDDESANARRLPHPSFRCSTPSDNGKPPTRLAVQHYTGSHDCQNGYLYLNMFVSTKSSCIRCATCFQLMTVPEFLSHLHSSDDVATLIHHSIAKPRLLLIQDEHFLSSHQQSLWQQFQHKNTTSLSPMRSTLKKKEISSKRRLKQNVQLSRVGRSRTMSLEPKVEKTMETMERLVIKAKPTERRSLHCSMIKPTELDSSRYSGRVRKRKQFSPDEGYTLPKVCDGICPKMKKSRSESLLTKRSPVARVSPLSANAYSRPVCKVIPRPVAKISPVQACKSPEARHRHRSGQR